MNIGYTLRGYLLQVGTQRIWKRFLVLAGLCITPLWYFDPILPVAQKAGVGFRILHWKVDILNCNWHHCCSLIPELGKYLLILGVGFIHRS